MTTGKSDMPRIGVICVGHDDYVDKNAHKLSRQVARSLEEEGIIIVWNDEIATDPKTSRQLARNIMKQDVEGIILFLASWIECPVAMSAVREIEHLPFALWGTPMFKNEGKLDSTGSFVSFAMFKGSLDRLLYNYKSIVGLPDDESALKKALIFCIAASSFERLKRTTIGLVGYTSMSIYPGTFDHLMMRKVIGPEIVQMDTFTLINRMRDISDEDCEAVIDYLKSTARIRDDVTDENLLTVSKMYLALKHICHEKDLRAINVKCQYELSKETNYELSREKK